MEPPAELGAAERELLRQGLRYSLGLRLVVIGASSVLSLLLDPPRSVPIGVAVVLALNAWNLGYAYLRLSGRGGRWRRSLPAADVAVMCAICLTQHWTVAPAPNGGPNWVLVALEIVLVTYPWQLGTAALAVATVALTLAYLAGSAEPSPGGWFSAGPAQVWTLMEALLSWAL